MSRDIYEEIASRHLQLGKGVFVRASHDPGNPSWTAEIDVVAIDLGRSVIIVAEVKSGSVGKFDVRAAQYENEIIEKLRTQLRAFDSRLADWAIERRLYVKSSYQKAAEKIAGPMWDVHNLDDAFNQLLKNE